MTVSDRFHYITHDFMCYKCGSKVPCTLSITEDRREQAGIIPPTLCPIDIDIPKWEKVGDSE